MTMPESAIEMEQRAERAVRRGELLVALELFEQLVAMLPDDDRLQRRIEAVRALLQPSETQDRREPDTDDADLDPPPASLRDAAQGELHASAAPFAHAL